jgi:hypothetical protein
MPLALALGPWQVSLPEVRCRSHNRRYSEKRFTLFFAFLAFLGRFCPPPKKKKKKTSTFGPVRGKNFWYL